MRGRVGGSRGACEAKEQRDRGGGRRASGECHADSNNPTKYLRTLADLNYAVTPKLDPNGTRRPSTSELGSGDALVTHQLDQPHLPPNPCRPELCCNSQAGPSSSKLARLWCALVTNRGLPLRAIASLSAPSIWATCTTLAPRPRSETSSWLIGLLDLVARSLSTPITRFVVIMLSLDSGSC